MLDLVEKISVTGGSFPRLKAVQIGDVTIDTPVILAPMAGVTDMPFRKLVKKLGGGLVVSEMVASQAMVRECRKTMQMIRRSDDDGLTAVQLAGYEPEVMSEAAKLNEDLGAPIIDINFGCPSKRIVSGHAGAALMRDETHAAKILTSIVNAVKIPVTLKMRLGWDNEHINSPRLAKIAEECGIKLVTVHGRTRAQFYGGQANWSLIRNVKEAVSIPVIANGDINDFQDVIEALKQSGADGVMIGRGSYGRPWFLGQVINFVRTGQITLPPSAKFLLSTITEHLNSMIEHYGEYTGLRIARKHIGWYSKGLPQSSEFRASVNSCDNVASVRSLIDNFFHPFLDDDRGQI